MNLPRLRRLPTIKSKAPVSESLETQPNLLGRFVKSLRSRSDSQVQSVPNNESESASPLHMLSNSKFEHPKIKTLLLDPKPASLKEQKYQLSALGYEVVTASNLKEAYELLETRPFDLLLSAIDLPDGCCIDFLPELHSRWEEMPVVLFTENGSVETARKALYQGASDYIVPPYNFGELAIIVERNLTRQNLQHKVSMKQQIALENTNENLLEALLTALTMRDIETQGHSERVTAFTMELADRLNISDEELYHIERGALLHDIGKIGIPDRILLKPCSLTEDEWLEMRKHPIIGYQMCENIEMLRESALIILHHHEAWDGSGYPSGLKGDAIPLGARIFAVADTFDAMTSDRPYRNALPIKVACEEILRCSGGQFDPEVVSAFQKVDENLWKKIRDIAS